MPGPMWRPSYKAMSQRWEAVADTYDAEKPKIAAAARTAPSIKAQAQQAKDAAGNGAQSPDGERYGATRL